MGAGYLLGRRPDKTQGNGPGVGRGSSAIYAALQPGAGSVRPAGARTEHLMSGPFYRNSSYPHPNWFKRCGKLGKPAKLGTAQDFPLAVTFWAAGGGASFAFLNLQSARLVSAVVCPQTVRPKQTC
jgi:hypothetical protein